MITPLQILRQPFRYLKQQVAPSYLGVDIGTTSVKIVEAQPGKQMPKLINYGLLESQSALNRPNVAFQTSSLKLFDEEVAEVLQALLAKTKPQATAAIASLPGFAAFTTLLSFPSMTDAELQKTIAIQAKQYVPLPMSEVAIEPMKVGSYEDDKGFRYQLILLITVPLEQIKKYQKIFKTAGLFLAALEIEGMSLARILTADDPTPTFIIDIGSRATAITIAASGQLQFVAQSDYAGASLTQAIAASLSINPLRAEELKKERGIAGTGPDYELSTIMLPFVDVIINEVKRANFTFSNQFPGAPAVERAIIAGGGANLLGLEKYMAKQLQIPVVKANPFARFEHNPLLEPLVPELNPLLAVALGLTLREL